FLFCKKEREKESNQEKEKEKTLTIFNLPLFYVMLEINIAIYSTRVLYNRHFSLATFRIDVFLYTSMLL
ncbi:MAG: hypothetical protein IKN43_01355, partial [Selenomonadaceae bacterium]|nr:hypothetical protein [Selenomonadaceae bacterium]